MAYFYPLHGFTGATNSHLSFKRGEIPSKINELGLIGAINEWSEPKRYKICCLANTIYITDGYKTQC